MNTAPAFESPEGLRRLLDRLHRSGNDAWRHDAEAGALLQYTIVKYGTMARSHHLEAADVAPIALENLRTRAVREALDPWAVLTRAVQLALIAEDRGAGLLCGPDRARKPDVSAHHDAYRFGERERLGDQMPAITWSSLGGDDASALAARTRVNRAVRELVTVFAVCDWARDVAEMGIEFICGRLTSSKSKGTAYEYLRRDPAARIQLDLSQRSWLAMLRGVLGSQNPEMANTWAGRGGLHAAVSGMSASDLLMLDDVVKPIVDGAPKPGERRD